MLWQSLLVIVSLALIFWSANFFLDGAAASAAHLGISPFTIGLTLVALGTSGPEIAVAVMAALNNTPNLAMGNVAGSNNANIGMVLGIAALYSAIPFPNRVLKVELPFLCILVLVSLLLLSDLRLSVADGFILISTLGIGVLLWRTHQTKQIIAKELIHSLEDLPKLSKLQSTWHFVFGLIVLLVSTELLVSSGAKLALGLGVSETFIGLTFIAVGTSLPELATTVGGVIKGNAGLAIGNVVGSNILNLALVLGLIGVLSPLQIESATLYRDFIVVLTFTLMLAVFAYGFHKRPSIGRVEGGVLLCMWIAYNALILFQSL